MEWLKSIINSFTTVTMVPKDMTVEHIKYSMGGHLGYTWRQELAASDH